jgi:hypothetical protein
MSTTSYTVRISSQIRLQSAGECGEKDSPAAPDEWGVQGTKNVSPCLGFALSNRDWRSRAYSGVPEPEQAAARPAW